MKKGCALSLATWAVTGGFYYAYLRGRFDPPGDAIGAAIAGFLMMMASGILQNAWRSWRDLAVLQGATLGTAPEDGRTYAAAGPIRPIGRAAVAPFSGTECVAYDYDVDGNPEGDAEEGQGNQYGGFNLVPSAIAGSFGRIKLLTWPVLDEFKKRRLKDPRDYERARLYVASTTFEPMGFTKVYAQLKDMLTDDDGQIRKDWKLADTPKPITECGLHERVVPVGEMVVAIGPYSAEKGGIVPGVGRGEAPVRLLRGTAPAVYGQLKSRLRGQVVGAVIMLLVVNVGLFLLAARYVSYYEKRRPQRTSAMSGVRLSAAGLTTGARR